MKEPLAGELWLDEKAWMTTGKPRLLIVKDVCSDGKVDAHALLGGSPGPDGVPLHYFRESMSWQGYWSTTYRVLPRLQAPFTGSPLENIPKAHNAQKLSGTADLINSILPSFQPSDVIGYNREGKQVAGVNMYGAVSAVPAGIPYLRFTYFQSHMGGSIPRPPALSELWYQKQASAWWLVRTLIIE